MILLYEAGETEFTNTGLGGLPDATYCSVVEERNGMYELELEYPITGFNYEELELRRIIMAKPNPYTGHQPFRIYRITKPINGLVTVYAEHISYDLKDIVVKTCSASTPAMAFKEIKDNSAVTNPFTFWTDKTTNASFEVTEPTNARALLGGMEGSVLDAFGGGEYEFDKFTVKFHQNRGKDRGVVIRYGKNMTGLTYEEDISSMYTHVFPYWKGSYYEESEDGSYSDPVEVLVTLDDLIVECLSADFTKILPLDCSQYFEEEPTKTELKEFAKNYITANDLTIPDVSVTASFVDMSNPTSSATLKRLTEVRLCDIVTIAYPELMVLSTSKCVKTDYNVLTNLYNSIELGTSSNTLAGTVAGQSSNIVDISSQIPKKSELQKSIDHASKLISGGLGGNVVIHSSSGDGNKPDEILIMDTDSIDTATNVWRWNKNGLGFSSTGYNGEYRTAITYDGRIVADFITAGTIDGALIKGGTITGDQIDIHYTSDQEKKWNSAIETQIKTATDSIELSVKKKVDKDTIINAINLSTEGIKIKGSLLDVDVSNFRVQATKLSWKSTYSEMSESGILKCESATLKGTMKCGSDSGYWMKMESDGTLTGGYGSETYGYMKYAGVYKDSGGEWHGVYSRGYCTVFYTNVLGIGRTKNTMDSTMGYTGSCRITYNMNSDMSSCMNGTLEFINGICVNCP